MIEREKRVWYGCMRRGRPSGTTLAIHNTIVPRTRRLPVVKVDGRQGENGQVLKDLFIIGSTFVFGPYNGQSLQLRIFLDGQQFGLEGPTGPTIAGKKFHDNEFVGMGFNKIVVLLFGLNLVNTPVRGLGHGVVGVVGRRRRGKGRSAYAWILGGGGWSTKDSLGVIIPWRQFRRYFVILLVRQVAGSARAPGLRGQDGDMSPSPSLWR